MSHSSASIIPTLNNILRKEILTLKDCYPVCAETENTFDSLTSSSGMSGLKASLMALMSAVKRSLLLAKIAIGTPSVSLLLMRVSVGENIIENGQYSLYNSYRKLLVIPTIVPRPTNRPRKRRRGSPDSNESTGFAALPLLQDPKTDKLFRQIRT